MDLEPFKMDKIPFYIEKGVAEALYLFLLT